MIYQTAELLEEIRNLLTLFGASAPVHLVGNVPHETLDWWYSSADFILSGSHYEGSGIAISEAMSCGCIPIVTNIASFRKMTGDTGLLYTPGDDNALFHCLEHSLEIDIPLTRQNVLHLFEKELSFDAIAHKINRIIAPIHL